ncbi:Alpha/beta hydrolase family protein (plasmid) [Variovorax sp. PBS-H4]|uniref:alpha/beta hydrolase family protein n=1 Tax=Variovorax sp. PBS-H4 TaxID=434008 RepID=UPI001315EB64|nr:prolyl oligopeptidase family serine peptidase [Variovorax sp. PBS-H4]VTU41423.1 Alpha/beta hydrolase family protein [Variovorax sp. PBS-H4]
MRKLNVMSLLHPDAHRVYQTEFLPDSRDYTVRSLLGKTSRGCADAGEVLATLASVDPSDHRAWFDAWVALGRRIAAVAAASAAAGHRVSAARAYLRAATYFATAVSAVDGLDGDESPLLPTFHEHRASWEGFVTTTAWPVERVDIPYEGSTMPGWFFRPDTAAGPRRTLVVVNGSDGSLSGLWAEAAEGALERGYNVLLFDGPGQQSMLFERDIPFRPDWGPVLTPVVDFLLARGDVDPDRLASYAISQGGYWLPQALTTEHRFAAAVADGGVVDVGRTWTSHIPHPVLAAYLKGDTAKFDREMNLGFSVPGGKAQRRNWNFRARPYGITGFAATLDQVRKYDLTAAAGHITTPLLVTDCEDEQFFPGQAAELAKLVPTAELITFTAQEGARFHCQPMARELTEQRVFDWLDEQLHP